MTIKYLKYVSSIALDLHNKTNIGFSNISKKKHSIIYIVVSHTYYTNIHAQT